jgi:hypothetical protein
MFTAGVAFLGGVPTAKNGLTRVGNHSKYGFGEFRVKPVPKRGENQESDTTRDFSHD